MAREIRITIDDDEVFERLRRRKRQLDLSWEEALRRGLRERGRPGAHVSVNAGGATPFDPDFGERIKRSVARSLQESLADLGEEWAPEPHEPPEPAEPAGDRELDVEIDRLADAEDAVLGFDFLDSEGAAVPLRVDLRTTADGLEVDVVAVRRGKGTEGTNEFAQGDRKAVASRLAGGGTATLEVGPGETYAVTPELSWARDGEGRPTVSEVDVAEVHLEETTPDTGTANDEAVTGDSGAPDEGATDEGVDHVTTGADDDTGV